MTDPVVRARKLLRQMTPPRKSRRSPLVYVVRIPAATPTSTDEGRSAPSHMRRHTRVRPTPSSRLALTRAGARMSNTDWAICAWFALLALAEIGSEIRGVRRALEKANDRNARNDRQGRR